jgi:ABC-type molybdenum transport system ATPase subunit/photorepair protein PhrA
MVFNGLTFTPDPTHNKNDAPKTLNKIINHYDNDLHAHNLLNLFTGYRYTPHVFKPKELPMLPEDHPVLNNFLNMVYNILGPDPSVTGKQLITKQKVFEDFIYWCAYTVQRPKLKTGVVVLLIGEQGTGKSTLSNIIAALHAPYTSKINDLDQLTSRFNSSDLENKLFIQIEEAKWHSKQQISIIKDLVTSNTIRIEQKFKVAYEQPNYFDIIITANKDQWTIKEANKQEERRFNTLDVNTSYQQGEEQQYLKKLNLDKQLKDTVVKEFKTYLYSLDIPDTWQPRDFYKNTGYVSEASKHNIQAEDVPILLMLTAWYTEEELYQEDVNKIAGIESSTLEQAKKDFINHKTDIYLSLTDIKFLFEAHGYVNQTFARRKLKQALSSKMTTTIYNKHFDIDTVYRKTHNGVTHKTVRFPSLNRLEGLLQDINYI